MSESLLGKPPAREPGGITDILDPAVQEVN
jgi:hypothetical protein